MLFSPVEIQETVNMFMRQKLDIRCITMGISLLDCADSNPKRACDKIYDKIMYRAQTRDNNALLEVERHHVIPRSEGGSSKKTNLVELTLKEHFLAHMLLIRMGKCTKYCYRHLKSSREYINEKRKERKKKGLYYEED